MVCGIVVNGEKVAQDSLNSRLKAVLSYGTVENSAIVVHHSYFDNLLDSDSESSDIEDLE